MKALVVEASGESRLVELPDDDASQLHALQRLVDGYIEAVGGPDWVVYVNEEGKLDGLPVNARATAVVETLLPGFSAHDVLVGTAVFLGRDGEDETHVPQWLWELNEEEAGKRV